MYYYEGHLGSIFRSDFEFDFDELYCEQCGDSDWCIGYFETEQEFLAAIADDIDIDGSGGWDLKYLVGDVCADVSYDEALKIVLKNRTEQCC